MLIPFSFKMPTKSVKTCLWFCLIVALAFFSCQSQNEKALSISDSELNIHVVDSISIPFLGNLMVYEMDEAENRILGLDQNTKSVLVFNFDGEILHSFKKVDGEPGWPGGLGPESLCFVGKDRIAAIGRNGCFIYKLDGEFLQAYPYPKPDMSYVIQLSKSAIKHWQFKGKDYVVLKANFRAGTGWNDANFFINHFSLELLDLESGDYKALAPFEKDSYFLSGKAYSETFIYPNFAIAGDRLFLKHQMDSELFSYQLPEGNLLSRFDTQPFDLVPHPGITPGQMFERKPEHGYNGSYHSLISVNGYLILDYTSGIKPELVSTLNLTEDAELRAKTRKNLIQIFDGEGNKMGEDIPKDRKFGGFISGNGKNFYALRNTNNLDYEPEDVLIYKLAIK